MPEYTYNADKPSQLLTGYGPVRGAELKEIHAVLTQQGDVPVSALEERFARPSASSGNRHTTHVDRCLKFLRAIDMVEVSAQDVVSLMNEDVYPGLSAFEPRLLHHVRQQEGEQYHLSYVFDVLIDQDRRRVSIEELLEAVQEDDGRSFDLTWRGEKLRMWANLANHVGAVTYVDTGDENEVLASPTRRLLGDLLTWYSENGDDPHRFARAMEWIDEEFLPVFSDRVGTSAVALGVADVLNDMETEGSLSLQAMSDTQDVVEVPRTRSGSRNVATFSIDSLPERPSYWYPLDRNERRVTV